MAKCTYTDGSIIHKNSDTRAETMCKSFTFYISLGPNTTHFDGEFEVVNTSLKQLFSHINLSFSKKVILRCKSSNPGKNNTVLQIQV
jgi:hypothetical protein